MTNLQQKVETLFSGILGHFGGSLKEVPKVVKQLEAKQKEQLSMAFNWKAFLITTLAIGESLEPVFIHNPKSQTIATILTSDVNALIAQLTAPQPATPVTSAPANPNPLT